MSGMIEWYLKRKKKKPTNEIPFVKLSSAHNFKEVFPPLFSTWTVVYALNSARTALNLAFSRNHTPRPPNLEAGNDSFRC